MATRFTNKEVYEKFKSTIAENGVMILAVSDIIRCKDTTDEGVKVLTEQTGAWVYTIGHKERGRPDLIAILGPQEGEEPMPAEEVTKRIQAVHAMFNYLVKNWEAHPVQAGHTAEDQNGLIYQIKSEEVNLDVIKKTLCFQAGNFYGSDDYALLVFIPNPAV